MEFLSPKRLAYVSALVPLAAFSFALHQILTPTLPEWAQPVVEAPLPKPYYLPLDVPLQAGPQGGTVLVTLGIAFVARLEPLDLLTVSEQIKTRQQVILADLNEILMQEAQADSSPAHLMQVLPPLLRDATNRGLGIETLPEPVHDVFITSLVVQ